MESESENEFSENDPSHSDHRNRLSLDQTTLALLARLDEITSDETNSTVTDISDILSFSVDKLHFHPKTGRFIHLGKNSRTAERIKPLDEFNHAVVMTHRPIQDDELFEIRIDKMVEKWSGSIEVGITTHNPNNIVFPSTMTNFDSGTIMMSGGGILTNGKGSIREYGQFNLDDLHVGDRIGLIRKKNKNLHYYINGLDQGVAGFNVAAIVWGVIDIYGRAVKVTIVDQDDHESANLVLRRKFLYQGVVIDGKIGFHPICGKHASVINNGQTVHRPNAKEDFNNAVVLTNRPLKRGELFEVRLEKLVLKWAGSIEIGVTIHSPTELVFPNTMTNVTTGTWMMTGNGVMRNGSTVMDNYGQNLDKLDIGDKVGVLIAENGDLHFYVNGQDQGGIVSNMPENLYGVVDLYGQAAEATIVENGPFYKPSTCPPPENLRFHNKHGRNIKLTENLTTAMRVSPHIEFNNAIVISKNALKTNKMFCVVIDKILTQWKGSLKFGVTTKFPHVWGFPNGLSEAEEDTWVLSGSSTFKDGIRLSSNYSLNLDNVAESSVIGIMRLGNGSLHYFVNNVDMGCAFSNVPQDTYVVIDLYGRCCQVSITDPALFDNVVAVDDIDLPPYLFHPKCGKNIKLEYNNTVSTRVKDLDHGLVFSSQPLMDCVPFEIVIETLEYDFSTPTIKFGLTTMNPQTDPIPNEIHFIEFPTWYFDEGEVVENKYVKSTELCKKSSFEWQSQTIGLLDPQYCFGNFRETTHLAIKVFEVEQKSFLYINGDPVGCFMTELPDVPLYAVVDIHGICSKVYIPRSTDDVTFCLNDEIVDSTREDVLSSPMENALWWDDKDDIYDIGYSDLESPTYS